MYTGTLIDDLIATVESAEERREAAAGSQDEELPYFSAPLEFEAKEAYLVEVA